MSTAEMGCGRDQSFRTRSTRLPAISSTFPRETTISGSVLPDLPFQEVGVAAPGNGDDAEPVRPGAR